jgi:hypothetical protein
VKGTARQHRVANCCSLSPALYMWGLFYIPATCNLPTRSLTPTTTSPNLQARHLHQLHPFVHPIQPSRSTSRDAIALRLSSLAGAARVLRLRLQRRWQWIRHHVCWLSAPHARCHSAYDGYRRAIYPSADQRRVQRRFGISRSPPVQRRAALPGRQLLQHQR